MFINKRVFNFLITVFFLCFVFFLFSGCFSTTEYTEEVYTIELDDVQKASATIAIYNGDLSISGKSQQALLISEFHYNLKYLFPEITYVVQDGEGKLKIIQKENKKAFFDKIENKWSLIFNREVPIELDIAMGSGDNQLDLSAINLTELKIAIGAGESFIDLTGNYERDIHIYLVGGIGRTSINLPNDAGIRLLINGVLNHVSCDGFKRIGNFYYNSAFDFSERKFFITIISGLGIIDINLI